MHGTCRKLLKGVIRGTDKTITKRKRTDCGLQNTTQKTKDGATRTTKHRGFSGRVISSFFSSGTRRVTFVTNPVISHR